MTLDRSMENNSQKTIFNDLCLSVSYVNRPIIEWDKIHWKRRDSLRWKDTLITIRIEDID